MKAWTCSDSNFTYIGLKCLLSSTNDEKIGQKKPIGHSQNSNSLFASSVISVKKFQNAKKKYFSPHMKNFFWVFFFLIPGENLQARPQRTGLYTQPIFSSDVIPACSAPYKNPLTS